MNTLLSIGQQTKDLSPIERIDTFACAVKWARLLGKNQLLLKSLYLFARACKTPHKNYEDTYILGDTAYAEAFRLVNHFVRTGKQLQYNGWEYDRLKLLLIQGPVPQGEGPDYNSEKYEMQSLRELIIEQEIYGYNSPEILVRLLNLALYYGRRENSNAKNLFGERWLVITLAGLHLEGAAASRLSILVYTAQLHDARGEQAEADKAWGCYYEEAVRKNEEEFRQVFHEKRTRWGYVRLLRDYAALLRKHGESVQAERMEDRATVLEPLIDISLDR